MDTSSSLDTQRLHDYLARIRAGDRGARDELLRGVCERLERLAQKMLRKFGNVRPYVQTDDVLQGALIRLMRGLEQLAPPESMAQFYALAAQQMRRELLDLARRYCSADRPAMRHAYQLEDSSGARVPLEVPDGGEDDRMDLERWTAFHEAVERLPAEEREVVSLVFYHGWTQIQVAELLGTTERTVRRRWAGALVSLHQSLVADERVAKH